MSDARPEAQGTVRRWGASSGENRTDRDGYVCTLPATDSYNAAHFLEAIGRSGGAGIGSGLRMDHIGVYMPGIRMDYQNEVDRLAFEIQRRIAARQPPKMIAEYAVPARRAIANQMRNRSGVGTRVLFEIRDWKEYGAGGRTFRNIERKYVGRGLSGDALYTEMYTAATHPNTGISEAAIRGARYLKYGGRLIVIVSVTTTAYRLMTTPPDQMERVIHEEAGGLAGGALGSGIAVGVCLAFGVVTGGWGLLACGAIGGLAGGIGGDWIGDKIYFSRHPNIEGKIERSGIVTSEDLSDTLPGGMCLAPLHSPTNAGTIRGAANNSTGRSIPRINRPPNPSVNSGEVPGISLGKLP